MKRTRTQRGFTYNEFTDDYGQECSLQRSSSACVDRVWLGVNNADPKVMASKAAANGVNTVKTTGWVEYPLPEDVSLSTRMHLNRRQSIVLAFKLICFWLTGKV